MDTVTEFNVGGMLYQTTVATCSSYPGVLKDIVDGVAMPQRDSAGRVFIDADGPLFKFVLDFLRHGYFSIPHNFSHYAGLHQTIEHLLPSIPFDQYPQPLEGHTPQYQPDALNPTAFTAQTPPSKLSWHPPSDGRGRSPLDHSIDSVVRFNVGGIIYDTTVATCASFPGVLKDIVEGVALAQRDAYDRIFIDSDGALFRYILTFMRHGYFALPVTFDNYQGLHSVIEHLLPALPHDSYPQAGDDDSRTLQPATRTNTRTLADSGRLMSSQAIPGQPQALVMAENALVKGAIPARDVDILNPDGSPQDRWFSFRRDVPYSRVGMKLLTVEYLMDRICLGSPTR
ncbi:hypothetical protein DIPPA_19485 [Diplonema papillatum]|nr:hypothetical protein DIPPA_19485 [Diplonema papillatum]